MRIHHKTTGNAPTPQPNKADEDTKPLVSTAPVSAGEVQSIRASLSNTNQGSSDDESSDDDKKPKTNVASKPPPLETQNRSSDDDSSDDNKKPKAKVASMT